MSDTPGTPATAARTTWDVVKELFDDLLVEERDRVRTTFLYVRLGDVMDVIKTADTLFAEEAEASAPITVEAPRLFSEVANDPDEWHHIGSCPYCSADHDEPEARFMNGNKVLRLLAALWASEAG